MKRFLSPKRKDKILNLRRIFEPKKEDIRGNCGNYMMRDSIYCRLLFTTQGNELKYNEPGGHFACLGKEEAHEEFRRESFKEESTLDTYAYVEEYYNNSFLRNGV